MVEDRFYASRGGFVSSVSALVESVERETVPIPDFVLLDILVYESSDCSLVTNLSKLMFGKRS